MNSEERAERELDELLKQVARTIQQEETGTHVTDTKRMREFLACAEVMKRLFRGAKFEVIPHGEFPSCGVIRIFAKSFAVQDTALFVRASNLASNYEIYPKTDGSLVMALTFYGMTKQVKE